MIRRINKSIYPKDTERNEFESFEVIDKAPKKENKSRKNYFIKNEFNFEKLYFLNVKSNINGDEIEDNLKIPKRVNSMKGCPMKDISKKDNRYKNCLAIKESEDNEMNEKIIPGSNLIPLNPILDRYKSVCKIKTFNSEGSGFLIKLKKRDEDFFCLMTNEHVVTKSMIENRNTIEVYYDNEKKKIHIKLNPNERIIEIFTYLDIDLSVVEILFKDRISTKFFLLPSIYYMNKYDELINENIDIIQYPNGKLSFSNGKIRNIKGYEFSYSASTDYGSSGSPIFLKDTTRVIGIHKKRDPIMPLNIGNFIGPIYRYFKDLPEYKYKSDKQIFDTHNNVDNNSNNYQTIKKNYFQQRKENKCFYCYEDGKYYIGDMKNGLPNGKGIKYYKDHKVRYKGEFIDGKKEGYGIQFSANGYYYIGEWKNNRRHGKGTLYNRHREIIYKGDFENDFPASWKV